MPYRIVGSGEMAELTRRFPWEKTSLGPIGLWRDELISTVDLLLASRYPMFLWWGEDRIQFYNDAYRPSIGEDKHPAALGQRGDECWKEIWPLIGPEIDGVFSSGESTWNVNRLVPIQRNGRMEEVFWTYGYSPVRDREGRVEGVLAICEETTEQVLSERRLRTLLALDKEGVGTPTLEVLSERLASALGNNRADIPFAMLYRVEGEKAWLAGQVGARESLQAQAEQLRVLRVAHSKAATRIDDLRERVGEVVCEPWPEPVEQAYLLPAGRTFHGDYVLVLGISPRLPFNSRYESHFHLVGSRICQLLESEASHQERLAGEAQRSKLFETVDQQRELLESIMESTPTGIALLDGELRVRWCNPFWASFFDAPWNAENMIGHELREVVPHPEDVMRIVERVRDTNEPFTATEYEYVGFARGVTYWRWCLMKLATGDILSVSSEVTEQVVARRKAQQQWAELEAIYGTAPIGLALFDPVEFRYLRLNSRQAEIVGLPAEEILGKTLTEIAPIEGLREMFEQVAQGKPVINELLEGELPMSPGEHRYWRVNYFPVYDANGSIQAISAASLEITALKRAEMALIQSEKIAAVGRLASSISHEINNPLEAITNLLYLLKAEELSPEGQSYLAAAESELARVSQIATHTLRFHRQATRASEVGPAEMIDPIIALHQGRLNSQGISIEKDYRTETKVLCFDGEIRQVLNNLIGNSLDATWRGGRLILRSQIATEWRSGRKGLRITIADTGDGMSDVTKQRLFEAFYTTKGIKGTGLGLWISAEIVQKHGGVLRFRSRCEKGRSGTVFQLFLPLEPVLLEKQETARMQTN